MLDREARATIAASCPLDNAPPSDSQLRKDIADLVGSHVIVPAETGPNLSASYHDLAEAYGRLLEGLQGAMEEPARDGDAIPTPITQREAIQQAEVQKYPTTAQKVRDDCRALFRDETQSILEDLEASREKAAHDLPDDREAVGWYRATVTIAIMQLQRLLDATKKESEQ
jgi:hypothetical protein